MTTRFQQISQAVQRLPEFARALTFGSTKDGVLHPSVDGYGDGNERVETEPEDALLINAKHSNIERYSLLLDLDVPAELRKSSTEGDHYHLYVDAYMTRAQHDRVLDALAEAGIVERGFAKSGKKSGLGSSLRLPWVKKGEDQTLSQQKGWTTDSNPAPF